MKKTVLTILLIATLSVVACSSSSAGLPGSISGESAIDREARQLAQQHFDLMFTRCGDSYYQMKRVNPDTALGQDGDKDEFWTEIKNPRLEVSAGKITDTDKMNGIEWQGVIEIFVDNLRDYDKSAGWSKWRAGKEVMSSRPVKTNGKWEFKGWSGILSGGSELKLPGEQTARGAREKTFILASVDCSKIPQ